MQIFSSELVTVVPPQKCNIKAKYESRFGNYLQQCVYCNAKYITLLSFRLEQMEKGNKCNFSFFREKTFYHYLFQWSKISIGSKVYLHT